MSRNTPPKSHAKILIQNITSKNKNIRNKAIEDLSRTKEGRDVLEILKRMIIAESAHIKSNK